MIVMVIVMMTVMMTVMMIKIYGLWDLMITCDVTCVKRGLTGQICITECTGYEMACIFTSNGDMGFKNRWPGSWSPGISNGGGILSLGSIFVSSFYTSAVHH